MPGKLLALSIAREDGGAPPPSGREAWSATASFPRLAARPTVTPRAGERLVQDMSAGELEQCSRPPIHLLPRRPAVGGHLAEGNAH